MASTSHGIWLAFSLLIYLLVLHASTLSLFTRGFLLSRLSLPNISSSSTLEPTHSRLVLLVIDALRFDFLSPTPALNPSSHYHHVLNLPARLTAQDPSRSFIFNTFSDPPTTTLQRIKGITTGSLPTFVDMGSNFAGSEIAEDSLVLQIRRAGRKAGHIVAFMGDDTWTTVYPTAFAPNMTFPFDSFNVEDLHTVDNGVIRHIFPLLEQPAAAQWDVLIGHFLGVDHVGHRLGPAHPTMSAKLGQMNDMLARVVDALDDDTLLVVMGDHGMDRKGDHGGDGEHETSAGTWIYSKSKPLASPDFVLPAGLIPNITFPGAPVSHRSIQQIDLVPTLSLLLGLPIPFNNLGTVVPELFGDRLAQALRLNAKQIRTYFDAYRASPSGGELDGVWGDIARLWEAARDGTDVLALHAFTRLALASCRSLWAQFNVVLMYTGLASLALGSAAVWALYASLGRGAEYWEANGGPMMVRTGLASVAGAAFGMAAWVVVPGTASVFGLVEAVFAGGAITSSITVLVSANVGRTLLRKFLHASVPLILHALAFLSNSFTFWEDRILTFLLITSLIPFVRCAFTSPQPDPRLRNRILGFSVLFAACVRLAGISTVCREEQHPYCHVTFYASSSLPAPPLFVLLLAIPASLALPSAVRRFLAISKSDKGPAPVYLEWGLRGAMLAGNVCWLLEWMESSDVVGPAWAPALRMARTQVARYALANTLLGGGIMWFQASLCLEVREEDKGEGKAEKQLIGFANAYGAAYLLFVLLVFALVFVATQLAGQIALGLGLVALLALLEVVDSARDVRAQQDGNVPNVAFAEIVPVALLALHAFFATGHQATAPSIQWKTAFLLSHTLSYYVSMVLVTLNTFGPLLLFASAVPLLALWKVTPLAISPDTARVRYTTANGGVLIASLRAALGMSLYFSLLLLGSAVGAAWLRRHLMVWKVFAPRFMYAGAAVLVVDVGVLLGVMLGLGRIRQKVNSTFRALL